MDEATLLALLKIDLQRTGADLGDDDYLKTLLRAAQASLSRQGVHAAPDGDYGYLVVGTAAWMYRKRVNGAAEPAHLRRLRLDLLFSQKLGGGTDAV